MNFLFVKLVYTLKNILTQFGTSNFMKCLSALTYLVVFLRKHFWCNLSASAIILHNITLFLAMLNNFSAAFVAVIHNLDSIFGGITVKEKKAGTEFHIGALCNKESYGTVR